MIDFNRDGKFDPKEITANMIFFHETEKSIKESHHYQKRKNQYHSDGISFGSTIALIIFAFLLLLCLLK